MNLHKLHAHIKTNQIQWHPLVTDCGIHLVSTNLRPFKNRPETTRKINSRGEAEAFFKALLSWNLGVLAERHHRSTMQHLAPGRRQQSRHLFPTESHWLFPEG